VAPCWFKEEPLMRWHVSALVLPLFVAFAPSAAHAWNLPKNETEAKVLYERLGKDFSENGTTKNSELNRARDGKRSSYLDANDPFLEQAAPIPEDVLATLPDAKWVSFKLFNQAIRGLRQILANFPTAGIRSDVLTIVDFGKKTEARRFLVLDLVAERVLFQTWVHHGRRSDLDSNRYAERFSNVINSNTSSVGFLLASDRPYDGMWGYSLRTHGIDGALNSNVHERAMVIHPWPTIHPRELARLNGVDQVSLGCLSLPYYESGKFYGKDDQPLSKLIIDTVKKRSVIFVSSPEVDLEKRSLYLRSTGLLPESEREAIVARVNYDSEHQPLVEREVATLPEKYRYWGER